MLETNDGGFTTYYISQCAGDAGYDEGLPPATYLNALW